MEPVASSAIYMAIRLDTKHSLLRILDRNIVDGGPMEYVRIP